MGRLIGLRLLVVASTIALLLAWRCPRAETVSDGKKSVKSNVPTIAQIMGVRVGEDTIEALEKVLGPGAPCLGGHPHGGRAWFIKPHNVYVFADGFEFNEQGRIVEVIQVGLKKEDVRIAPGHKMPEPKIPQLDVGKKAIGWLGKILPGASKDTVLRLTKRLPRPKREGDSLRWTTYGTYRYLTGGPGVGYREWGSRASWSAELTFEKNRLVKMEVSLRGVSG